MDCPIGEAKASRWDSSCTITAVDDKDKTMPSTSEACQVLPKAMARAQMMAEDSTTCSAPAPNTHRRIAHRRSAESSSPIMNIRNSTPRSARADKPSPRGKVNFASQGQVSTHKPSP